MEIFTYSSYYFNNNNEISIKVTTSVNLLYCEKRPLFIEFTN